MPVVIFRLKDNSALVAQASSGETLLEVALKYNVDLEGACGGAMACSTCHVIVDQDWIGRLTPATGDENDILDLAPGLTRTSRLACQIKLTDALDGLSVTLPK